MYLCAYCQVLFLYIVCAYAYDAPVLLNHLMTLSIDQRAFLITVTDILRDFNDGKVDARETAFNLRYARKHLESMSDPLYRAEFEKFAASVS